MLKKIGFWFFLATLVARPVFASETNCRDENAIWSSNLDGKVIIFYYRGVIGSRSSVRFEAWHNSKLEWQLDAKILCSNGVVFCSLELPLDDGEFISAGSNSIYESDQHAKYLIFDHLKQSTFRIQSYGVETQPRLKVEYANGKFRRDNLIVLPTYYKFLGCKK